MASTNPARGMRDFLPSDVRKRNYVIGIIKEVYESYGFEPLETPAVENIETLMGKYGDEGNQLIFKILKRGEKLRESLESGVESLEQEIQTQDSRLKTPDSNLSDLALRYDLTVPLARVVANNKNELPKFFKRYQIQPVWRADRPARGRFREFYQCDVDAIGSSSMVVEADLISAVSEILTRLGFKEFEIRLNHRNLLSSLLHRAAIPESLHSEVLTVIDKLDKIGANGVGDELKKKRFSLEEIRWIFTMFLEVAPRETPHDSRLPWLTNLHALEYISAILGEKEDIYENKESVGYDFEKMTKEKQMDFLQSGLNRDKLKYLVKHVKENPVAKKAMTELYQILAFANNPHVKVEPSLVRGLSYYTGTIMEINVPDLAGSLGGGGRYDGLIGMFGKEQIPACGFSLGLERILVVMDERNMFPAEVAATSADVMVTIWNEESIGESLKLANELRSQGLRVVVYPEADKLGKQIKYADTINVPWVCVLGDSEIAENKVTLKNMASGEQKTMTRDKIAEEIKSPIV
jgi:histidyl-tRNA synthetase